MIKKGIILLLLCTLAVSSLVGCSVAGSDKNNNMVTNGSFTPEETIQVAFDALKELDIKTFDLYTTNQGSGKITGEDKELLDELFVNLSYEIGDAQIDGDKAVVNVKITNTDFSEVISQLVSMSIDKALRNTNDRETDEELLRRLVSEANQAQKQVTSDLELSLESHDKGWKIRLNDETLDVLCGNLMQYMNF